MIKQSLGAEIEVPTLTKNVLLEIPPETQTGKVFKLKDKGAGSIQGRSTGDLYVRVVIETPQKISSSQRKAIEEAFKGMEKNFSESADFANNLKGKE